jgi:sec-independent protein translocase protein TatA
MVVPLAFMGLGAPEVLLILLAGLVLFGADKLPRMAQTLGRGLHEFKSAVSKAQRELEDVTKEPSDET